MENKKEFTFYYDEAYHDLAITQKNGIQNIDKNDASAYFVVSLVGAREENIDKLLEKFTEIEKNYKKKIGISIVVQLSRQKSKHFIMNWYM